MSSFNWSPIASGAGGGVEIYANLAAFPAASSVPAGTLGVAADTGVLYESDGATWSAIGSPGAALSIGTLDSGTPSANGAHIDANALIMQSASATVPGLMNTSSQTMAGAKTFTSTLNANGGIDRSTSGTLTIGATNSTVINIGNAGATVNIQGTTIYENTPQLLVADPLINVNSGGGVGSGQNAGVAVEEDALVTGYVQTSSDRNSWDLKAPNTAGIATITPGVSGFVINQGSHDAVTLAAVGAAPNADGASLSGQQLTLQPASASFPGLVTTGTQSLAGAKTFTTSISSPNHIVTGATSGAFTLNAAATTTDYTLTFPSAQGAAYTSLVNGGSGTLFWGGWAQDSATPIQNCTVVCSVNANALTVAIKTKAGTDPSATDPVVIPFRSATATEGIYTNVLLTSATSIVVPQGATLGRSTSASWPMYVWFINNSGTAELAVSTTCAITSVINTSAISGSAISATVVYSTTGRSSVPATSVAVLTINLTTQTNYDAVPTEVVLTNGALDPSSSRTLSPTAVKNSALGGRVTSTGMAIGANASSLGNGIAIGPGASCVANTTVAIGTSASAGSSGASGATAIGGSANLGANAQFSTGVGASTFIDSEYGTALGSGTYSRAIGAVSIGAQAGYSAGTTAEGSISIGLGVNTGAFANAIAIVPGSAVSATAANSAANQMAIGDSRTASYINDVRFGRGGVATSNAVDVTLGITGIAGSDAAGKNLTIQGGNGTGTGGSGQIRFQTAPAAGSSSTANTMVTRGGFDNAGGFFLNGTTSGTLTIKAAAATTSHTLTMPSAQGAADTFLKNDGAGTLSWATTLTNPMDAIGQIIYGGASGAPTKLAAGTSGQLLVSGGAAAPTWQSIGTVVASEVAEDTWPIVEDTWGDLTSISLTAGTWSISYHCQLRNNAEVTSTRVIVAVGTASGTSTTGTTAFNKNDYTLVPTASGSRYCLTCAGVVVSPGSTTTYYLKGLVSTSGSSLMVARRITAVRIA